jgi:predicted TIM-barrel fold metal-dependent hydrolase
MILIGAAAEVLGASIAAPKASGHRVISVLASTNGVSASRNPAAGRIDVHAHYLPTAYQRALHEAGISTTDGGMPVPAWSVENHLAHMQRAGITTSILSLSSPGVAFLDGNAARRLARSVNEAGSNLKSRYRGKFGFFATLPLADVPGAVDELRYALDHLDADGVCLETNSRGIYLGDPVFTPLFAELSERATVVYLHPTSPACSQQVCMGLPAPMLEFPVDTARAAVSLIFNGTLNRFPRLKVILSHAGGALPILASRIAGFAETPFATPRPAGGAREVVDLIRAMYFDLALSATPATFQVLLQITTMSHLLFGSDFPWAPRSAIEHNDQALGDILSNCSAAERQMIEYGNAGALFPSLLAVAADDA